MTRYIPALSLLVAACGGRTDRGNPACGIAALAAPNAVLEAFTVPQQSLSVPPIPPSGTHGGASRGRSRAALPWWAAPIRASWWAWKARLPPQAAPAFGVLVVQRGGAAQGVMLFEGTPVEAAPKLGLVSVGGKNLPLFGVEVDMAGIQDARCPLFPDSIAR